MLSRHAEAKALIDRTPLDCYNCVRVRGVVAQHMGDRAGAQRWFLDAARQGSRLAPAFLDWGRLLADSRRYATAEPKIRRAAELAPNWADPLKSWGDLLAAQGRRGEAMAKYDAALKLAPQWVELRQARSRLQAKS
jgi:tetratricopeptide (TPR) repeat protein